LIVLGLFYGLAAIVATFIAWFALMFTTRYPAGLYGFVAGFVRFSTRVSGYFALAADTYPPFDGDEHPEYPVRIAIPAAQERYSRGDTLFRYFYLFGPGFALALTAIPFYVILLLSWLRIVITGRQGEGFHRVIRYLLSLNARLLVFQHLLTEEVPQVTQPGGYPATTAAPAPVADVGLNG
jgi:hypothetical protein